MATLSRIFLIVLLPLGLAQPALAQIGIISPADANKLIEEKDPAKQPIVLDTRGGYKDYFRGHIPTAHHINFDTLRGTDNGVPVVASLYGSGTTTLRQAAYWGTATTFAGSITALFLAEEMLTAFSGRGLVSNTLVASPHFICAVAMGTAFTSFLATRFGFPVSTTHAMVGALIGAGLAGNGEVQWAALGKNFLFPLFFSPIVAALTGAIVYLVLKVLKLAPDHRTPALDRLHFLSTGAASFARGLNDTPKMVALLLLVPDLSVTWCFVIVAVCIALGGLLDIRRVAETLGKKITGMNPGQGFAASLVTAGLVTTASLHGLPVSTTHVSVGALTGMGTASRQTFWRKVFEIVLAWVSTVPCGAMLAALAYAALTLIR